jgi:ABC-type transport system involved in multi-copper enzyme maturation permease subunit
MNRMGLVAVNVFRESVRDKVLYNLVAFAVLLMSASYLLGQLTAGQDVKIIKDLALSAISVFGLLIAVFIGIGLVWKEVERRSIYGVLSKPIRRYEFIVGKYLGLLLTLAVNVVVMTMACYGVLAYLAWTSSPATLAASGTPAIDPRLLQAIVLIAMELALVTAIALFFSTFSSPFLSAGLTFGLWVAGHFNEDLRNFDTIVDSPVAVWVTRALYYVLPNFSSFDIKAAVVHGQAVSATEIGLSLAYGVTYIAFLLVAAVAVFERRDLR